MLGGAIEQDIFEYHYYVRSVCEQVLRLHRVLHRRDAARVRVRGAPDACLGPCVPPCRSRRNGSRWSASCHAGCAAR